MAQLGTESAAGAAIGRALMMALLVVVALVVAGLVAYLAVVSQNPHPVTGGLEVYGT